MKKTYLLFILIIFISSCAPVYIPNTINVPQFHNKNEKQLGAYAGSGGFEVQGAYSVTPALGIIGDFNFAHQQTSQSEYDFHHSIDLGIGYYKLLSNHFIFETYAGLGDAKIKTADSTQLTAEKESNAELTKFFLQPQIGYYSKTINLAFTTRMVYVSANSLINTSDVFNNLYIEPAFTLQLGFKRFFLVGQFGLSLPANKNFPEWYSYQPLILSVGIRFKFGSFYKTAPRM